MVQQNLQAIADTVSHNVSSMYAQFTKQMWAKNYSAVKVCADMRIDMCTDMCMADAAPSSAPPR